MEIQPVKTATFMNTQAPTSARAVNPNGHFALSSLVSLSEAKEKGCFGKIFDGIKNFFGGIVNWFVNIFRACFCMGPKKVAAPVSAIDNFVAFLENKENKDVKDIRAQVKTLSAEQQKTLKSLLDSDAKKAEEMLQDFGKYAPHITDKAKRLQGNEVVTNLKTFLAGTKAKDGTIDTPSKGELRKTWNTLSEYVQEALSKAIDAEVKKLKLPQVQGKEDERNLGTFLLVDATLGDFINQNPSRAYKLFKDAADAVLADRGAFSLKA
jgi:hypothetical protein